MQNIAFGDVFFVLLVLGLIHGIMHLLALARKRKIMENQDSETRS